MNELNQLKKTIIDSRFYADEVIIVVANNSIRIDSYYEYIDTDGEKILECGFNSSKYSLKYLNDIEKEFKNTEIYFEYIDYNL